MKWFLVKLDRYNLGTSLTTCPPFDSEGEAAAYRLEKDLPHLSIVYGSVDAFGIVTWEVTGRINKTQGNY